MSQIALITTLACLSLTVIAAAGLKALREIKSADPAMRSWARAVLLVGASGALGTATALTVAWTSGA